MPQIAYYGSVISPNITRTPEGYLICKNVPIGRVGTMEYLGRELGIKEYAEDVITVYRTEEDLFDIAAIASFEGKPVTNDHPPQDVDPSNYNMYAKGHTQNVRRGSGSEVDLLLADLYITDPTLSAEIEAGRRQVSSGYDCVYSIPTGGPPVRQREIRGNHVAVVDYGRAGPSVSIKDSVPESNNKNLERRQPLMSNKPKNAGNGLLGILSLLARGARDAKTTDEMQELVQDAGEAIESLSVSDEGPEASADLIEAAIKSALAQEKPPAADNDPEPTADEDPRYDALVGEIAAIKAMLEGLTKPKDEAPADPIECLINELAGTTDEDPPAQDEDLSKQEEALTVAAESMDDGAESSETDEAMEAVAKDAAVAILKTLRPAIASIKDAAEKKRATDALCASVTRYLGTPSPYAAIVQNAANVAKAAKAKDAANNPQTVDLESRQTAYDKRNPHNKQ